MSERKYIGKGQIYIRPKYTRREKFFLWIRRALLIDRAEDQEAWTPIGNCESLTINYDDNPLPSIFKDLADTDRPIGSVSTRHTFHCDLIAPIDWEAFDKFIDRTNLSVIFKTNPEREELNMGQKAHRIRVIIISESDDADGSGSTQHQKIELVEGASSPGELCYKAPLISAGVIDGLQASLGAMAATAVKQIKDGGSAPWE